MEYHIHLPVTDFVPTALHAELLEQDPSALAVMNNAGDTLRVFAEVDVSALVTLLGAHGVTVTPAQVEEIPALCCGGCT